MARIKIGTISKELGVPVPTVRRWTIEFAASLSEEAQGVKGGPREFSPEDVKILKRAKELLGLPDATYKEVRLKLQGDASYAGKVQKREVTQGPASSEKEAVDRYVLRVFEDAIKPHKDKVEALENEVEELKRKLSMLETEADKELGRVGVKRRSWPLGLW